MPSDVVYFCNEIIICYELLSSDARPLKLKRKIIIILLFTDQICNFSLVNDPSKNAILITIIPGKKNLL